MHSNTKILSPMGNHRTQEEISPNSMSFRPENTFHLNQQHEQHENVKKPNRTLSTRSKIAKSRIQFARVRKNSLNRNFFNTIGVRNNCTHQVCFPPIGNLLIGRRNFLFANSTCGLYNAERFCILGNSNLLLTGILVF